MNKEVCAIVVTFNRERLLIENIESLLKQTLKLKWIIIVDNNSQGYKEVKENISDTEEKVSLVKLFYISSNKM